MTRRRARPTLYASQRRQRIDSETQTLLDALVESLPAARLLLLVNYRPEYEHAWNGKTYYAQLRVDPLPAANAETLLKALVRDAEGLAALGYLRQTGKALSRSANREAAIHFEQALAAFSHLPESRATAEQAIDLRFELRQALQPLGEHQRVLDYLREAEMSASTYNDRRRLAWVSVYLTQYRAWNGDLERADETGERALTIGAALGDFGLQVVANFFSLRT